MASGSRVPIPWSRRWQQFRLSALPTLGFLCCLSLTLWLWYRQGRTPSLVGEIQAPRVDVAAQIDGVLIPLLGSQRTLFDVVQVNEVIARLDDRPVQAKLDTLRCELVRLGTELDAAKIKCATDEADRRLNQLREVSRLAWQVETHRLSSLDRKTLIEADRVVLQRYDARLGFLRPLRGQGAVTEMDLVQDQFLRDEVAKRIEENSKALKEAESQKTTAENRLKGFPSLVVAEAGKLVAPYEAALKTQESRIREIQLEIERLDIRSPIAGKIAAIYRYPSQSVRAGDPIVAIADDRGRYILGYVHQEQGVRPMSGQPVDVRERTASRCPWETLVNEVGPQVEEIPIHQRRNQQASEWGHPVRIALPEGFPGRPGELVDITFRSESSQPAQSVAE